MIHMRYGIGQHQYPALEVEALLKSILLLNLFAQIESLQPTQSRADSPWHDLQAFAVDPGNSPVAFGRVKRAIPTCFSSTDAKQRHSVTRDN